MFFLINEIDKTNKIINSCIKNEELKQENVMILEEACQRRNKMDEYINKIKYLKERVKISLKDVNGQNEEPFDSREDCIKELDELEKILNEIDNKGIFQIYSSQLSLFEYEDLDEMSKIASEIVIADDCLLYDALKNIIDKGE